MEHKEKIARIRTIIHGRSVSDVREIVWKIVAMALPNLAAVEVSNEEYFYLMDTRAEKSVTERALSRMIHREILSYMDDVYYLHSPSIFGNDDELAGWVHSELMELAADEDPDQVWGYSKEWINMFPRWVEPTDQEFIADLQALEAEKVGANV